MVEKFCCFRLESTAKFFGWFGTIVNVLLTILSIVIIVKAQCERELLIFIYILMVITLINVGAHISLTLGAYQKRPNLIMVWLISTPLGMLLLTTGMVFFRAYGLIIILPTFYIYFWIAMESLYRRIESERQTGFSHLAENMPKQMA